MLMRMTGAFGKTGAFPGPPFPHETERVTARTRKRTKFRGWRRLMSGSDVSRRTPRNGEALARRVQWEFPGAMARRKQGHALGFLSIPLRRRAFCPDGDLGSSNRPFPRRLPGLMSQSAVVRDYRPLEIGWRRANRLVLTIAGRGASLAGR